MNKDDKFGNYNYSALDDLKPGQTILKVPDRSPLVIAEKIKPYIKNKVVCELGSSVGDFALEMAKYAKSVIGVEIDEECVAISRKRGLHTICADAINLPPLPEKIDVYYMWMEAELTRKVFNNIKGGLVIMAGELEYATQTGHPRGIEVEALDEIRYSYPHSWMLNINYDEGDGERQSGVFCVLIVRKRVRKMKNLMIYFSPEKRFSGTIEDLVKRQINNSLKLGWKKKDLVLLTNFPYQYLGVKTTVVDESLFCNVNDNVSKTNAVFHLLEQNVPQKGELWLYHDLDCFQLHPIDGSEILLGGGVAGFIKDNGKYDLSSFFFRRGSHKVFEWIRNRSLRLKSDEATALTSLAETNYRNIKAIYKKLKSVKIFERLIC